MRVVLADAKVNWNDTLRRVLLGEGLTCEIEDVVEYEGLSGRLAAAHPDLVIIHCNGAQERALKAIRTAHQITDAPIVVAGEAGVLLVREAMRAGAQEFLDLGKLREELSDAVTYIESFRDLLSKRGKIIALFSPSGGAGVSTTAVNLAIALAGTAPKAAPERVALVDLNPPPTDLSSLLDLEPKYTLADVCRQWERLDTKMLSRAMVEHASGIHVLAQSGCPHGGVVPRCDISPAAVRQTFVLLRRMYPLVVVDLGHTLSEEQVEAMRQSNLVGMVARPDVPGLRRANWALEALRARGLKRERFQLVLNSGGGCGQVRQAKVEAALHMKVFWTLPENAALVTRARNEGVPLSRPSARWLARLSARLRLTSASRIHSSFAGLARDVRAHLDGAMA